MLVVGHRYGTVIPHSDPGGLIDDRDSASARNRRYRERPVGTLGAALEFSACRDTPAAATKPPAAAPIAARQKDRELVVHPGDQRLILDTIVQPVRGRRFDRRLRFGEDV